MPPGPFASAQATDTFPSDREAVPVRKTGKAPPGQGGSLQVRGLSKHFVVDQARLQVLENVSFDISPGEFVCVVGASGCGKSTLLRHIVGLDEDYDGEILFDGERIRGPSLDRGVVFQDHRLLPWMTIAENVGLGLENSSLSKSERRDTVQRHLDLVGLAGFENVFPHQLSGGMAQRAAIARGLVNRPKVLLLDEPFGALDALTRAYLQDELLRIWRQERIMAVLITHDVDEALYLADRVFVMHSRPGRIHGIVPVGLSRPRDRVSHAFADLKREVLEHMALRPPASPDINANI